MTLLLKLRALRASVVGICFFLMVGHQRFLMRLACPNVPVDSDAADAGNDGDGSNGDANTVQRYYEQQQQAMLRSFKQRGSSSSESKAIMPWDGEPLPEPLRLDYKPSLLDRTHPLVLLKQDVPITSVYNFPNRKFAGECSCENPNASLECCQRTFRRSHKFGCVATMNLLDQYGKGSNFKLAAEPKFFNYNVKLPDSDYRDVIVLRDLWSGILSGYLYHFKGFECGMADKIRDYLGEWDEHLSYKLQPPRGQKTLCQYLSRTGTETIGLRAYIDWVMRYYYTPIFSHWAMSREVPEMQKRTLTVCYEDLMSKDKDTEAVHSLVNHFFDGRPPSPWEGTAPGHAEVKSGYMGGHSTTKDRSADEKERLIKLIKMIDQKYYHGEIAWLNSIQPCSSDSKGVAPVGKEDEPEQDKETSGEEVPDLDAGEEDGEDDDGAANEDGDEEDESEEDAEGSVDEDEEEEDEDADMALTDGEDGEEDEDGEDEEDEDEDGDEEGDNDDAVENVKGVLKEVEGLDDKSLKKMFKEAL